MIGKNSTKHHYLKLLEKEDFLSHLNMESLMQIKCTQKEFEKILKQKI